MDIEVQTHRYKVSQPRIFFVVDGPYIDEVPEKIKERDRKVQEACDVFNKALIEIHGGPSESSWAGSYYWEEWMDREGKLAYALALENFKTFLRQLAVERYALYVDRQRIEDAETKTP